MTNWAAIATRARALLNQEGLSVFVKVGETTCPGVRTTLRRQDVNTDVGLIEGRYQFSVLIAADALPELPPRRTAVFVNGAKYRLISTEQDSVGACVRLNLGDPLA